MGFLFGKSKTNINAFKCYFSLDTGSFGWSLQCLQTFLKDVAKSATFQEAVFIGFHLTVCIFCDDTLFPPKRNGVSKCAIFSAHDWLHIYILCKWLLIRLLVLHLQIFNLNKKWHMAGINFEFDNDIHPLTKYVNSSHYPFAVHVLNYVS